MNIDNREARVNVNKISQEVDSIVVTNETSETALRIEGADYIVEAPENIILLGRDESRDIAQQSIGGVVRSVIF